MWRGRTLGDAGLPDRILWHQAVAERYDGYDLDRVGIDGGAAGGQNAMGALLFHGDFYHAAVADNGCHDDRMDKIWGNELWMGKVGPHYDASSNVTTAHLLRGKLLLTVGELDTNVDPSSTYQVADALIRAGKDFEFLMIPGGEHARGPYHERKRFDFFVRHFLGLEPPDWNAQQPAGRGVDGGEVRAPRHSRWWHRKLQVHRRLDGGRGGPDDRGLALSHGRTHVEQVADPVVAAWVAGPQSIENSASASVPSALGFRGAT